MADGEFKGSVCPHDCPSTCALEVEVRRDADGVARGIGTVRGAEANSYTAGVICAKVARYAERVHHPDRLLKPLLRTGPKGSGQFREIGWEEALDRVAAGFAERTAKHGSETVWPYYYAGTMGLVQRDGIHRLRHAMRYSGQQNTICTALCESGWQAGVGRFGGPDPREMAEADLIVMWGGNPVATQVNVMTHVTRARKSRGAKFVVVDPYRTGTAAAADLHLALRPGTDGALACAVMHIAFRDGHADRDYIARMSDAPPDLEAHLAARGPDWASGITGLPVAQIEAFAKLYGETERAYIRCGYGFSRSRNGAASLHAVTCLPTVTGKWRHLGGGAFWNNRTIYHWDKTLIEGLDVRDPSIRTLDQSRIGAVLTGDRRDLGAGPPVTALLIQSTNPAVVAPASEKVRRGFLRDDLFTVVHEQFMTDTARYADIVLPATMFVEHDDLYQAGGHTHIQLGPKLVEPPGECRSNHEVLQGLATRLGAQHRGFGMTAREIADWTLRASGWPGWDDIAANRWHDAATDFATAHFETGFGHADGKFRFAPDWAAIGEDHAVMPRLPDHMPAIDAASEDHPFRMVTAPARQFLNTTFTETPGSRKREGRPTALIHPRDAARLGIEEGGRVRLGNAQGEVVVTAKLAEGQQEGVVIVESIWPNPDFAGGIGINLLVSDDRGPPKGGAVFHDTAVWVRPAVEQAERLAAE
ncbi:molybdopterin-containing oxidoreductase family protein [Paracraurococcus ruber]|uniref:Dehydrogenase n=1 Tax=Paracraurococcus ruber TaxID=77675 RepID=A0ABS1CQX4_9PROT|nr:molybdopterin oxidoreductase family protein [Paracraurococcus ruber]MBK1656750.1 dehydrogenase [Paracraurococcus ruber]TDG30112.1 molybdopterin oxidoreductase family protein [Paracraurococcus ruber]